MKYIKKQKQTINGLIIQYINFWGTSVFVFFAFKYIK